MGGHRLRATDGPKRRSEAILALVTSHQFMAVFDLVCPIVSRCPSVERSWMRPVRSAGVTG